MKVSKEYLPAEGATFGKVRAKIYGKHLAKLQTKVKILTPEIIMNDARSKDSPIHDYFDWNDKTASEKYRLHSARSLLNHIKVKITHDDESEDEIRKFHHIKIKSSETQSGYVSVENVIKSEDYYSQIIKQALMEIQSWKEKYYRYQKLRPIIIAIREIEKKIMAA